MGDKKKEMENALVRGEELIFNPETRTYVMPKDAYQRALSSLGATPEVLNTVKEAVDTVAAEALKVLAGQVAATGEKHKAKLGSGDWSSELSLNGKIERSGVSELHGVKKPWAKTTYGAVTYTVNLGFSRELRKTTLPEISRQIEDALSGK